MLQHVKLNLIGEIVMEFNNRLYELRKQRGFSQEELAGKLNVSRQTISKWEVGDSTPDMEKLMAISDLFDISLDELVSGKTPVVTKDSQTSSSMAQILEEKILTSENKKKTKKGLKIAGIIAAVILAVDVISMIIYFLLYGIPK